MKINSPYMKDIFTPKETPKVGHNNTMVNRTIRFGTQGLRSLGPKIWNNLQSNMKSETSFLKFNEHIKTLLGQCMLKHLNRKCCQVFFIHTFMNTYSFLYIFIVTFNFNVFSSDLIRFRHDLYFFYFCITQILLSFPRINKTFIRSFIHSRDVGS